MRALPRAEMTRRTVSPPSLVTTQLVAISRSDTSYVPAAMSANRTVSFAVMTFASGGFPAPVTDTT